MKRSAEDMDLVRRCVSGDASAWRTMLERYGALVAHAVRNTLQRVLRSVDSNQVDEVVQSVWLSLCEDGCRRLRGFRSKAALTTWLTVLSTRRTLDYIRGEGRKGSLRHVRLDDEDRDLVKELQAPESEERFAMDEVFRLREILDRLPPADRLILKMYYLDGLSYRSVARTLRIAPNTVSSYVLRAREKFKKCMSEGPGGVQ